MNDGFYGVLDKITKHTKVTLQYQQKRLGEDKAVESILKYSVISMFNFVLKMTIVRSFYVRVD